MSEDLTQKCELVSGVLRSIAHPARLKLLCRLAEGEATVNELMEYCGISQSAVSQFLSRMKLEGLVEGRRDGQFVRYRISDPKMLELMVALQRIYCS